MFNSFSCSFTAIPYKEGFGSKQLAWLAYSGVFGAVLAPMALMGGPLLIRAAWYTAGVVGGTDNISIALIHCKMFFYFYIINVLVIHLLTVYILIISTKPNTPLYANHASCLEPNPSLYGIALHTIPVPMTVTNVAPIA
jgi:hypothetical protein